MTTIDFTPLDDDGEDIGFLGIGRPPTAVESAPPAEELPPAVSTVPAVVPDKPDAQAAPAPHPPSEAMLMAAGVSDGLLELRSGEIIDGTILSVSPEEVVVDINYKTEGIIPREEIPTHLNLKVGQTLKAMVLGEETDEGVRLSYRKAIWELGWRDLEETASRDGIVNCKITALVKASGYRVDIGEVSGFLPASQLGLPRPENPEELIGQQLQCKIIKFDRDQHDVVVSHRKKVEDTRAQSMKELIVKLKPGDTVTGVVTAIRREYAFIDVGGVDAFLHISNLSWRHVKDPHEVIAEGEELTVRVLEMDPVKKRISVGLKQMRDNPWKTAAERYPVGKTVSGTVVSLARFGAFVELEEGVVGLVPLKEISWNLRLRHPSDELQEGDTVTARVINVAVVEEKIGLSLRAVRPDPWAQYKSAYKEGDVIEAQVKTVTPRAAFVSILNGIEGIIRQEDISWDERKADPADLLQPGERYSFKILRYDDTNHLVRLGLKQVTRDPWVKGVTKYAVGKIVEGKVVRITDFGAFVELEPGLDGLVHISQLSNRQVSKVGDVVKVGERVKGKVAKLDTSTRRINISIRDYLKEQERQEMQKFIADKKSSGVSLGDMLGIDLRELVKDKE